VESVVPGSPDRLRFTLVEHGIERHDGIQLDVPERERPFGFSAEQLWVEGRPTFEAAQGATVDVALPESHPRLPVGAPVYCASSQVVKRTYRWSRPRPGQHRVRQPVSVWVEFTRDALHARLECAGSAAQSVLVADEPLGVARTPDAVLGAVERAFGKLGDTEFCLAGVEVENPQGLFAPASMLNELRRRVVQELEERLRVARTERVAKLGASSSFTGSESSESWSLMTDQPRLLAGFRAADWDGVDEVVLDISRADWAAVESAACQVPAGMLRLALPAANLSGLTYLAPHEQLDVLADWPLYVLNTPAMACLDGLGMKGWTLSPEDGRRNLAELLAVSGGRAAVTVYQDTPLAISATCLFASASGFCPGRDRCEAHEQAWTTRAGDRLLAVNDHCRSVVLGDRPFCLSGRIHELRQAGGRRFRVDFVWRRYEVADAQRLWGEIRADRALPHTHTGNLDRGLDRS
jgi:hypothetical protein